MKFFISVKPEVIFVTPKMKQSSYVEEIKSRFGLTEEGTYIISIVIQFSQGTPEELI